ncbi:hypothetical protein LTR95_014726 [Oleoguttula sp. CCFEE 5521]
MAHCKDAVQSTPDANESVALLRLPTELRCQIFDLVLGADRYIHVGELGHGLRGYSTNIHRCLDPPKQPLPGAPLALAPWTSRHSRCMQSKIAPDFQLPLVCRAFHAALCPALLSTTTFIFADRVYLENFLARLKSKQRAEIRHIVLCCTSTRQPWRLPLHDITLSRLTGLRKLTIYVEVTREDLGPYRSDHAITREGQDGRLAGLARFRWLRLAECDMIIVQPLYIEAIGRVRMPDYVEAAWVKRMTRLVLGQRRDSVITRVRSSDDDDGLTAQPGIIG